MPFSRVGMKVAIKDSVIFNKVVITDFNKSQQKIN